MNNSPILDIIHETVINPNDNKSTYTITLKTSYNDIIVKSESKIDMSIISKQLIEDKKDIIINHDDSDEYSALRRAQKKYALKPDIKEKKKEYAKKYYLANKDKFNGYYLKNKEEMKKYESITI